MSFLGISGESSQKKHPGYGPGTNPWTTHTVAFWLNFSSESWFGPPGRHEATKGDWEYKIPGSGRRFCGVFCWRTPPYL